MDKQAALAVIRHTEAEAGGTFYGFGGPAVRMKGGFMVGGIVPTAIVAWGQTDNTLVKALQDFTRQHKAALADSNRYLGTWVDDKGLLYIDVSEVVYSKYQAVVLGLSRGELAIWDNRGEEIDLLPFRQLLCDAID